MMEKQIIMRIMFTSKYHVLGTILRPYMNQLIELSPPPSAVSTTITIPVFQMRRGTEKASNTAEVSQQKQDLTLREVSSLDTIMPFVTELYWSKKK